LENENLLITSSIFKRERYATLLAFGNSHLIFSCNMFLFEKKSFYDLLLFRLFGAVFFLIGDAK